MHDTVRLCVESQQCLHVWQAGGGHADLPGRHSINMERWQGMHMQVGSWDLQGLFVQVNTWYYSFELDRTAASYLGYGGWCGRVPFPFCGFQVLRKLKRIHVPPFLGQRQGEWKPTNLFKYHLQDDGSGREGDACSVRSEGRGTCLGTA